MSDQVSHGRITSTVESPGPAGNSQQAATLAANALTGNFRPTCMEKGAAALRLLLRRVVGLPRCQGQAVVVDNTNSQEQASGDKPIA